jgi:hypothetical protein
MTKGEIQAEFQRQVDILVRKGYPALAGISSESLIDLLASLADRLTDQAFEEIDIENGRIPFVIVITHAVVPTDMAMSAVDKNGKHGVTKLHPRLPQDFKTISDVVLPNDKVYILIDIDRGKETLNVAPSDALKSIKQNNRSPLTIDEGVAIVTHFPEFLIKNNCFSLLASRDPRDKRVPAIWINAQKNPNLGWCWDGNPHTWLGSASCRERVA